MLPKLVILGISGVTCGGKTTLATKLKKIIPSATIISQDTYFFCNDDPRHTWIATLNHVNYDIISSLDMDRMFQDVTEIMKKHDIVKFHISNGKTKNVPQENLQQLIDRRLNETNTHILILEGFCIFNYKPLADLCSLKYYFNLSKEECYKRRIQRVYDPPDCPGYFETCVWPEYLNLYQATKDHVANVVYYDGSLPQPVDDILADICNILQSFCKV